jgi:hypothetical protein
MKRIILFSVLILFTNNSTLICRGGDTTWIPASELKQLYRYDGWGGGFFFGVNIPVLSGHTSDLLDRSLGFMLGFGVNYKRYFFRVDGNWKSTTVNKSFIQNGNWEKGHDYDGGEAGAALGYVVSAGSSYSITSFVSYFSFGLKSPDNQSDSGPNLNLDYYGPMVILNHIINGHEGLGAFQVAIGLGFPSHSTIEEGFNDPVVRIQLNIGYGIF